MKIKKIDELNQENSAIDEFANTQSPSLVGELWTFIKENKAYWIVPAIIVVLFMAVVMAIGMLGGGAMAPFIYTLF